MRAVAKTSCDAGPVRDDYLALIRNFPLRKIRSAKEHAAALAALDPLMVRGSRIPSDLSEGELDYLGALAVLIHAYETPIRDSFAVDLTPVDRIRFYMDMREMKPKDLAPHVGGKSAVSMILNGKRPVSREQAKKLAVLFHVDAGKFL